MRKGESMGLVGIGIEMAETRDNQDRTDSFESCAFEAFVGMGRISTMQGVENNVVLQ